MVAGLSIGAVDVVLGLRARSPAAVLDEMLGRLGCGSPVASAWLESAGRVSRLVVDRGVAVFRRAGAARGGDAAGTLAGMGTIPAGADFGSHDSSLVSLVFLVVDRTAEGVGYQKFLSALFGQIAQAGFREALLGAGTAAEAAGIVRAGGGEGAAEREPAGFLHATV